MIKPQNCVDVIIPFHRVDEFLIDSIKSAQLSSGVEVRIIAVNDSELITDKDVLGLRGIDLLVKSKFKGYLGALASGFLHCESEFIAFLDSDDLQDANRIREQIDLMNQESADISSCNIKKFVGDSTTNNVNPFLGSIPIFLDERMKLVFGAHGADSSMVIRLKWVKENYYLHEKFPYQLADYAWMMLLLTNEAKYVHCSKVNYYYRLHGTQISRSANLKNQWAEVYPIWINFLEHVKVDTSNLNQNTGLLIAFPSSLAKFTRSELRLFRTFSRTLAKSIDHTSLKNRFAFEKQIAARELIGRRGLTWKSLWVGPLIAIGLTKNRTGFSKLRWNKD